MIIKHAILHAIFYTGVFCSFTINNEQIPKVLIIGQMKDVMWKGELEGRIHLDTISNKNHLFGMGPIEFLSGEIIVLNGRAYYSFIDQDNDVHVKESFDIKAPFFAYTSIPHWKEIIIPETIKDLKSLETFLNIKFSENANPVFFQLKGNFTNVDMHIVNLPKGRNVSSPKEAHEGLQNFKLNNVDATILGFYSTKHQSIFTHHDTYLHLHVLTDDFTMMGHVDELEFDFKKVQLFAPEGL